jgi:hypothetical protein
MDEQKIQANINVIQDNNITSRNYTKIGELLCTYIDLKELFGEPIRFINSDKRVIWGFRELETDRGATIYDDNIGENHPINTDLDKLWKWNVGGDENENINVNGRHMNRSLNIIGQIFITKKQQGKKFKSKPI